LLQDFEAVAKGSAERNSHVWSIRDWCEKSEVNLNARWESKMHILYVNCF